MLPLSVPVILIALLLQETAWFILRCRGRRFGS
jgi:hypothetical protein